MSRPPARPVAAGHAGHAGGAGNWAALPQQFDDEVTAAPEYDPRFLRRVAGPDYQSSWVWTYGANVNGVDHHQVRAVGAGALALKAERTRELPGLRECAENLVLAKARLARGRRFSSHPRTSPLPQPRSGSFA